MTSSNVGRGTSRADRVRAMLDAQDWRCALACAGDGRNGRPISPGDPVGFIDDGTGVVHLACLQRGVAPSRAITEACECGHMLLAHSAVDGCTLCPCDLRHVDPSGQEDPSDG